uniref:Uncharacterized protein n=1 Tax=Siphoviridae sp. ctD4R19 TaxID=2823568 RepID=A0A8S5L613_9CAUD|nr:MAG TPA: hypothetical protein [Siphoviridae sp. ctD4R19]
MLNPTWLLIMANSPQLKPSATYFIRCGLPDPLFKIL